jgi:HSP20 family molecular chaperone IbpA
MKRMYLTLALMFGLIFYAGTLLGQQKAKPQVQPPTLEKRMQMREEMHRRMMDMLLKGTGPDQDMFQDMEQFMDEVMSDSFSGFDSYTRTTAQNYKMEWTETSSGRTLEITPKNPEQKLDINVKNGMVVIEGKSEEKTPHGMSVANFSNSFNVPGDCDPARVKMDSKNGKILIQFPYITATKSIETKPKAPELKPLAPSEDDVKI